MIISFIQTKKKAWKKHMGSIFGLRKKRLRCIMEIIQLKSTINKFHYLQNTLASLGPQWFKWFV
jgi:hypothetical protein